MNDLRPENLGRFRSCSPNIPFCPPEPWCGRFLLLAVAILFGLDVPGATNFVVKFNSTTTPRTLEILSNATDRVVYQLETSTNLIDWQPDALGILGLAPYPDLKASNYIRRFFRAKQSPILVTNLWSNQLIGSPAAKFFIPPDHTDLVYFHPNSVFHYDFARNYLPQFTSTPADVFEDWMLHPSKEKGVIGGVFVPTPAASGGGDAGIYFIEFASNEPIPDQKLADLFKTVRARIIDPGHSALLLPPAVQRDSVLANRHFFITQGISLGELTQFVTNTTMQAQGWSIGKLVYIPANELPQAISSGMITPQTILISDRAPLDLPPIAGLVSLTPSSPNSHTVLRLQTAGFPYLDLRPSEKASFTNLAGQEVILQTHIPPVIDFFRWNNPHYPPSWFTPFGLIDAALMSDSFKEQLLRIKSQQPVVLVEPIQRFGSYGTNTDGLTASHARFFGSKSANYGRLRRAIPTNSQPAVALSFDVWLDFMAQSLPSGSTLQTEIAGRLQSLATNKLLLPTKLKEIRELIIDQSQFTPPQKIAILKAISSLDSKRKIRFRSSSNAEDLPNFSAAGLYDSFSGCKLDDLQGVSDSVCLCDPDDTKSRSIFRAIQKVFASFYNDQAYAERRQFLINESQVGMAILVHYSFPDEIELANGIVNVDFSPPIGFSSFKIIQLATMVSQRGAGSVANPVTADLPETVQVQIDSAEKQLLNLSGYSTLPPLGVPVLSYPGEYSQLFGLLAKVGGTFQSESSPGVDRLNFEYKKTPAGLFIKQVRPVYTATTPVAAMILPGHVTLYTFQGGESVATLQSSHELKSIWEFDSHGWLTQTNSVNSSLIETARVVHLSGGKIVTNLLTRRASTTTTNLPTFWASYVWTGLAPGKATLTDTLVTSSEADPFYLEMLFPVKVPGTTPFVAASDLVFWLKRPGIQGAAELLPKGQRLNTFFPADSQWQRTFGSFGVVVDTRFNVTVTASHAPVGIGATMNLAEFVETKISGLTGTPFLLHGYFSQTYKPTRHNFTEEFLFEPALEEELEETVLQELKAKNIKQIYYVRNLFGPPGQPVSSKIELIGFDGSRRQPSPP
jgi:hypothetical protein